MSDNTEIVEVNTKQVKCEGESSVIGHPLIYLTMGPDEEEIVCPYCSKTFKYKARN